MTSSSNLGPYRDSVNIYIDRTSNLIHGPPEYSSNLILKESVTKLRNINAQPTMFRPIVVITNCWRQIASTILPGLFLLFATWVRWRSILSELNSSHYRPFVLSFIAICWPTIHRIFQTSFFACFYFKVQFRNSCTYLLSIIRCFLFARKLHFSIENFVPAPLLSN